MKLFDEIINVQKKRGFTIVELIVVMSIVIIISGVVIAKYQTFNSSYLLGVIAQEMAVTIRLSQTYGISVKGYTSDNGVTYQFPNYGIHVDISNNDEMILFVDIDGTAGYSQANDAIIETYKIPTEYFIKKICVDEDGNVPAGEFCDDNSALTGFDILFKRPNPEARINSINYLLDDASLARFYIGNNVTTKEKRIEIRDTGQISVY